MSSREFTIYRMSGGDLRTTGKRIAAAWSSPKSAHKFTLGLIQTDGGKFVVSVTYVSDLDKEHPWNDAYVAGTMEEIANWLATYNPCKLIREFSPGEQTEVGTRLNEPAGMEREFRQLSWELLHEAGYAVPVE